MRGQRHIRARVSLFWRFDDTMRAEGEKGMNDVTNPELHIVRDIIHQLVEVRSSVRDIQYSPVPEGWIKLRASLDETIRLAGEFARGLPREAVSDDSGNLTRHYTAEEMDAEPGQHWITPDGRIL
jgi:hypothetical protein